MNVKPRCLFQSELTAFNLSSSRYRIVNVIVWKIHTKLSGHLVLSCLHRLYEGGINA